MQTKRLQTVFILGAFMNGCSDDETPEPFELADEPDARPLGDVRFRYEAPEAGDRGRLVGWISAEELTLRFEVRRGPEVPPEVAASDSTAPSHEIDVRLLSSSGQPFIERIGGHAFIDPIWSADTESEWLPAAFGERQAEWALVHESLPHLRRAHTRRDVKDLHAALVETIEAALVPSEEHEFDDVTPRSTQASSHVHFEVWWKWADIPWLPNFLGHHSSTRTTSHYPNGNPYATRITCNHGTCAATSGMSLKTDGGCPRLYLNRSLPLPPSADCLKTQADENYSSYSCCATKYGVNPDNGRHVCHDDTRVQNALAAYGSPSKALGYCSDNDLAQYAPSCVW